MKTGFGTTPPATMRPEDHPYSADRLGPGSGASRMAGSPVRKVPSPSDLPGSKTQVSVVDDFRRSWHDGDKMQLFFTKYRAEIRIYGIFAFAIFASWVLISDGDFSFTLTLASLISMCSFLMMCAWVETHKSCQGVSVKMLEIYLLLQFARLCAVIPFEGYLPFDKSGDWFYQVVEAMTFCFAGSIVYLCRVQYPETYASEMDTFDTRFLIAPALVLSLVLHPQLNAFTPSDICWAFALYMESLASLPQLFMFQREGKVHPWTAHFLAAQVMSKVANFIFWTSSFSELQDPRHLPSKYFIGYWVLIVQGFQILLMGDFILQYTRCVSMGVSVSRLLTEEV
ncbi:unnamed protein product [Amoebophrya sp. A25]|nr:unnamed protein product [Amoebophrya sp. A25]|eukprot:GSA25T00021532001.1